MDKDKILKLIFAMLSNPTGTPLSIINCVKEAGDFMATQDEIYKSVRNATVNIIVDLVKCNLLRESNEQGNKSITVKRGRGIKKYYAVHHENWQRIEDFKEAYSFTE